MVLNMEIAVIGGSGFYQLNSGADSQGRNHALTTPYADEPVIVYEEQVAGRSVAFLPRHGKNHSLPPHRINYRANIHALHSCGVRRILAVNAVGGIGTQLPAGSIAVPEQLLDYTWGREHTFFDGLGSLHDHIDFTWPYDAALNAELARQAGKLGYPLVSGVCYACTQGPRLETAAEVQRIARDGGNIIGMTGMPEAALARELGMAYACLALIVNPAAGTGLSGADGDDRSKRKPGRSTISATDIHAVLDSGMQRLRDIILATIASLD